MRVLRALLVLFLVASPSLAQDDPLARIAGAASRGGAMTVLETLTDTVGGRVTGSKELRAASELILSELKKAGYANAHFEEYPLEARWARGQASGRITSPPESARALVVGSYGWVPGTASEIQAPLLDLGSPETSDSALPPGVKGAAVLVDPRKVGVDPSFVMRAALAGRLAAAGAVAMLIPSDKPHRMVYTSAFGLYPRAPLPVISVAKEDSLLLRRLLGKGAVKIALDVRNTFDTSPYQERNVIADLPGASADIVLIGAHYDSWDPAQGANDDGSGVAAVLEAARILKSLGIKPRRTLRFAFFSGEEEACLGSRAYVKAHETDFDRLRAVLVMDSGAQAPRGVELHGRADLDASMKRLLAPLAPFGATATTLEASFDQDHAPFMVVGVPAMTLWVEEGDYDTNHHAVTDTLDKIDPRLLAADTAVVAMTAYLLADSDQPIGRRLSPEESADLLKKAGVEGTKRMVYAGAPR
ncbi:MAG TPA: M20/M25/M40 family metallo-hydrolase [Thermoanaerobaculia bacterium]